MPEKHSLEATAASALAHRSWAKTRDRTARTANGRANSPASHDYWRRKLVADDPSLEDAPELDAMAKSAKSAYFAALSLRGVEARREAG